jgi:hypothetical protein
MFPPFWRVQKICGEGGKKINLNRTKRTRVFNPNYFLFLNMFMNCS